MEREIAVSCRHVTKKYSLYRRERDKLLGLLLNQRRSVEFTALSDINVNFYQGEIVGIIGLNGSGKSTLASIITGISYPTSGEVTVKGSVNMLSASAGMESNLTGRENIRYKCLLMGLSARETARLEDQIIEFADIGIYMDQPIKMYSSGMQSRLGFAISVHMDPDILIVDEALSVGDGSFADKCLAKMDEFKRGGKTILFVSHSVMQMNDFCDKVLWLHKGKIVAMGQPQDLILPYCGFAREYNAMTNAQREEYVPAFTELAKKHLGHIPPKKISIFGSCVSRDALEFDAEKRFSLGTYIARQSMVSSVSPPIEFSEEELKNASPFRKRAVVHDLEKDAFSCLQSDGSEYLLIDLIDERFALAEFRGSIVTVSNEFREAQIEGTGKDELKVYDKDLDDPVVLEKVDEFCRRIREIYPQEKIILQKALFLDRYYTKDGHETRPFPGYILANNKVVNAQLERLYARVLKNIPGAYVIDLCGKYQCHEAHKWGLSPYHYEAAYYQELIKMMVEYVSADAYGRAEP